jgi:hypothetical protein
MALLDGDLRAAIARGFAGLLLPGVVTRTVPGGGLDEHGDPIANTTVTYACQGFVETFSAFYRAQAGIPDTDVKITLIGGLTGTRPQKDDRVTLRGTVYQIRRIVNIDPAEASYELQGYQP